MGVKLRSWASLFCCCRGFVFLLTWTMTGADVNKYQNVEHIYFQEVQVRSRGHSFCITYQETWTPHSCSCCFLCVSSVGCWRCQTVSGKWLFPVCLRCRMLEVSYSVWWVAVHSTGLCFLWAGKITENWTILKLFDDAAVTKIVYLRTLDLSWYIVIQC